MNNLYAHVGMRLKIRRRELGLTQKEVAAHIGVAYQQLQKYESGKSRVDSERLFELAHFLKVDIEYFFDASGRHASEQQIKNQPDVLDNMTCSIISDLNKLGPKVKQPLANFLRELTRALEVD
ncbi:MAG: helix-turn-helix domain-containing protein [Alphaproteobacteria bacterium]|nr:helix-turn-helix domain-containing protein [Alphaproteobacteria bacterium]